MLNFCRIQFQAPSCKLWSLHQRFFQTSSRYSVTLHCARAQSLTLIWPNCDHRYGGSKITRSVPTAFSNLSFTSIMTRWICHCFQR
jgi:hypothetical protein